LVEVGLQHTELIPHIDSLKRQRQKLGQLKELSTSNINHIWDFALETGHQDIRLSCLDFMQKHFEAVVETRGFGTLSEDVLSHLISSDSLVVSREEQVVESIFKWAASACNQSNSSLAASLPRLLSFVRWEEVSESYISELLGRNHQQSSESACTKCLLLVGEYSPDDVQWSVQTVQPTSGSQHPLAVMKQRDVSQMVALNGLAYVIGGQVNHKMSTSVVEFNPMTGRWRRVASSLLARWGHATAGFGCGIVSCGGVSDSASVVFAELFLPAKNSSHLWLLEVGFVPATTPRATATNGGLNQLRVFGVECASTPGSLTPEIPTSSLSKNNSSSNRPERRTVLVARELARYKVDIAALSETDSLNRVSASSRAISAMLRSGRLLLGLSKRERTFQAVSPAVRGGCPGCGRWDEPNFKEPQVRAGYQLEAATGAFTTCTR
uniref:BACK domain-containing protein n=1 Tax=Schistocephalus solidus TaxID=70667 RepID=A0A183T0C9_SCHSO